MEARDEKKAEWSDGATPPALDAILSELTCALDSVKETLTKATLFLRRGDPGSIAVRHGPEPGSPDDSN
jgi:hypothetical protein